MAFDGANDLTRWEATDLFGELLATYDPVSGTVDEVVRNHLGTNQEQARDSFGNPVLASTGFSSHALTWHTQDPTGLIYARARYVEGRTRQWVLLALSGLPRLVLLLEALGEAGAGNVDLLGRGPGVSIEVRAAASAVGPGRS